MPGKRSGLSISILRKALLVALVAVLVGTVALFVARGRERSAQTPTEEEAPDRVNALRNLLLSGQGFEYELMDKGRRLFHIRADEIISEQEDDYSLAGVELTMTREDGRTYYLESDRGTYRLGKDEATLEGAVLFRGPSGIVLRTEGLQLERKGRHLASSAPVQFEFLDSYVGSADRLRLNLRKDVFILEGNVAIDSRSGQFPIVSIRAQRLSYERRDRLIRAEGNFLVRRNRDWLSARRATVQLTEDESAARLIRASFDVKGETYRDTLEGMEEAAGFMGRKLLIVFDEATGTPKMAELESSRKKVAMLSLTDSTGASRQIRADYLVGEFTGGELTLARAQGRVEIYESLGFVDGHRERTICADSAVAELETGGAFDELFLEGGVDIHEQGLQAHGDRMMADSSTSKVELLGDMAWVLHSKGYFTAPRITYSREDGKMDAGEGVQARLAGAGESAIVLGSGAEASEEPVQVVAKWAEWAEEQAEIVFRDEVRAWQGENYLLAQRLIVDTENSLLRAEGQVKTVFRIEATDLDDKETVDEGDDAITGDRSAREPIEVTSGRLVYKGKDGVLIYSGGARALQARRSLSCREIHLFRTEQGEIDRLACEGPLRMEDPDQGKTVTGSRGILFPDKEIVRIFGDPVVLKDVDGATLRGQILVYDLKTGRAQLQSQVPQEPGGDSPE